MPVMIRVWSPESEPPVHYFNDRGELVRGRYVARALDGKPIPEGESVIQTVEIIRDIRSGHLVTTKPVQE